MGKLLLILAAALSLTAATTSSAANDNIGVIARDYVVLALGVKHLEPDWIEAPEVPAQLRAQANAADLDAPAIIDRTGSLIQRLDRIAISNDRLIAERHGWLKANLVSLRMQLQAKAGAKWPMRARRDRWPSP
jgi:hypothetical protein